MYEDAPLVRAALHGRVCVLDEADKAPLTMYALVLTQQYSKPGGQGTTYYVCTSTLLTTPTVYSGNTTTSILYKTPLSPLC